MVARLATRLQVDLIHTPVVQLLAEGQGAHFLHHVQLPGAVEVQYRCERPWVPVEKVLVVVQVVVVAYVHEGFVGFAVSQFAQARAWQTVQGSPQNLMGQTTDVQLDPPVARHTPNNIRRLRGERGGRPRANFTHSRRWFIHGAGLNSCGEYPRNVSMRQAVLPVVLR